MGLPIFLKVGAKALAKTLAKVAVKSAAKSPFTQRPNETTNSDTLPSSSTPHPHWAMNVEYMSGDVVIFQGSRFQCITSHTSFAPDWNPTAAPSLWRAIG
ncbi:carbohydrate-binding protein [Anabaena sp. FACHB-709]|uniref:Chitin-binding type-3 domain-containing protein n=2 Tax=Nostocaceae TaxID=1162 RepID=A0A1Z4KJF1_ANAVA|nr:MULTISPECIES: carbohydrate-binding protein [Nostocaceae]BAY69116.1 hypothetical protein NIES23_19070 [Trichormus variabilis NIES-23]HBW32968.1 hypothetical protein [Nostoc sp. UBA8866]MBD2174287.1 hypothetical protein [Anabaena cylindrica FACHB-318]MBD2263607.1 hypothetical protein [Anabaena sp. FACHB-709]MBD2275897.1 hypothetical protein [Nostoc sp. PCC 7120 = FACHB-418]